MSKIDPQLRLSAPKFQKNFFAYLSIFLYLWEKIKRYHYSYFEYLSKNSPKLNQNYYWFWVYFGLSVSNGQIRITVLNYTVVITNELLHLINMLKNLRQILITRALLAPEKGQWVDSSSFSKQSLSWKLLKAEIFCENSYKQMIET